MKKETDYSKTFFLFPHSDKCCVGERAFLKRLRDTFTGSKKKEIPFRTKYYMQ